jgi:hypothetical protein
MQTQQKNDTFILNNNKEENKKTIPLDINPEKP